MERLYEHRYGDALPDDDAGRGDIYLAAHHIAGLGGEFERHIERWCGLWAPWFTVAELRALLETLSQHGPERFKAGRLGQLLGLTGLERDELKITTIRACDRTGGEQRERRRAKKAECERKRRQKIAAEEGRVLRARPGRPRKGAGQRQLGRTKARDVAGTNAEPATVPQQIISFAELKGYAQSHGYKPAWP
jgi:hypothetical protein